MMGYIRIERHIHDKKLVILILPADRPKNKPLLAMFYWGDDDEDEFRPRHISYYTIKGHGAKAKAIKKRDVTLSCSIPEALLDIQHVMINHVEQDRIHGGVPRQKWPT